MEKVSACPGALKALEIHENGNKELKSEGQECILRSSKKKKPPLKKGEKLKKYLVTSNKKRDFKDDFLIDKSEEDDEEMILIKAMSRKAARKLDDTMDKGCLDSRQKKFHSRDAGFHSSLALRWPNSDLGKNSKSENTPKILKAVGQDAKNCHQCMNKEITTLVHCTKCKQKMYCIQCIKQWYPGMSEEEVSKSCPFCDKNCNCTACLCSSGMIKGHFL